MRPLGPLSQSDPRRSGVPPSVDANRSAHHRCPTVAIGAAHHRRAAIADWAVRDDRPMRSSASGPINATGADNSIGF